jgi:hypothetical protein
MIEGIGLPSILQILDGVAADAAVEKFKTAFGMPRPKFGGDQKGVAVAELKRRIDLFRLTEGIGDGVTLEQDFYDFLKPDIAVGSGLQNPYSPQW